MEIINKRNGQIWCFLTTTELIFVATFLSSLFAALLKSSKSHIVVIFAGVFSSSFPPPPLTDLNASVCQGSRDFVVNDVFSKLLREFFMLIECMMLHIFIVFVLFP